MEYSDSKVSTLRPFLRQRDCPTLVVIEKAVPGKAEDNEPPQEERGQEYPGRRYYADHYDRYGYHPPLLFHGALTSWLCYRGPSLLKANMIAAIPTAAPPSITTAVISGT